jgi:hypothetical protein
MTFKSEIRDCIKSMKTWPDVSHVVTVYNCNDDQVCEACRKIEGEHYDEDIYNLPELPLKGCTNPDGCRCWIDWSTALGMGPKRKKRSKTKSTKRRSLWDRLSGRAKSD